MALTDNNGTQYYQIGCGIPSTTTNLSSNNFTGYYHASANDFILWAQEATYPSITSNNGSQYYFLEWDVPSDPDLNLESNNGTAFYYNPAFNAVSFCNDWVNQTLTFIYDDIFMVYDDDFITYSN